MPDAVVELRGVTKRFAAHLAVKDLSLSVPRGVIYGLLGPNGAGKTTSIRMINDIVKPDEGTITLFGSLAPGRAAQRRIGYLPEERGLYPKMTVRRVLTFLAELRGLDRTEVAPRVMRWLERLELGKWLDAKVETLSKGMQQKVQFIATVLHEPDLLILDEPFSGLDPLNADVLRAIVLEQKAAGRTILFSTHLMEHAEQLCDALCILARSERVLEGSLADVKATARDARNAYRVEIAREGGAPPAALATRPGMVVTRMPGDAHAFDVELAVGRAAGDLLRSLVDAGEEIVRFERHVPTLHEIFVDRVRRHGAGGARDGTGDA
ncbi:MAG TPA: ATP-binding cassette domain-containing protein [Polyangiaceae bacterium]|jgi:ABC-2 type transport system ATP-binding protein